MGLPKIIQIPCHHVSSNQNALKFKKGAPFKQFFNINLGIGIIKKTTFFVHIFDISPCVFTQFLSGERSLDASFNSTSNGYPHCILLIDPSTPKIRNTWKKKCDDDVIITFFQVFMVFGVAVSIKSMQCEYSLDEGLNFSSNDLSHSEFE